MGLRCKVDNDVGLFAFKECINRRTVCDITAHKRELRMLPRRVERRQIPRIGQHIITNDGILWMFAQFIVDKICTDKARATRDNNLHIFRSFSFSLKMIRHRFYFSFFVYK